MQHKENVKPIIETLWYKVLLTVFFIAMFYYGTFNSLQNSVNIWARPRYTSAKMLGLSKNFRITNHSIEYEYYKNGIRKKGFLSLPKEEIDHYNLKYDGGKYLLIYDSLGLSSGELLYKCGSLPDTIFVPDEGWSVPPIPWCDKRYQLYDSSFWYNWLFLKTIDVLNIKVKPKEK
jgi:hypothetical protein